MPPNILVIYADDFGYGDLSPSRCWLGRQQVRQPTALAIRNQTAPAQLASGLSALNLRVGGFEFKSSVVDFHSPVDTALSVVDIC